MAQHEKYSFTIEPADEYGLASHLFKENLVLDALGAGNQTMLMNSNEPDVVGAVCMGKRKRKQAESNCDFLGVVS